MLAPQSRGKYVRQTFLLAALLISTLVIYNAGYLFHTAVREMGDAAADSLSVLRASHFKQLHGAYSRWSFYHPGPALFYFYAALEAILSGWWHAVPTAYNAHVLGAIVVTVLFFAGGIGMAARWVQSGYFVPLALLFAAVHFTGVNLRWVIISTWQPQVLTLVFFCLLVAAASVAAGQGEDLPWLVLAGSFAIHLHVAQPLFALPMFIVGYGGLAWSCYKSSQIRSKAGAAPIRQFPWRLYPGAHIAAGLVAAVFLLPLLLDCFLDSPNDLALILDHMRQFQGQHHPWLDSVYYFLRFSSYKTTLPYKQAFGGGTRPGEISHYFATHLDTMLVWSAALLSPLLAFALNYCRRPEASRQAGAADADLATTRVRPNRWRFFGWLSLVWLLSLGLTLVWGRLQDGEMAYYNAWFNYSIYFVLALLAAIALSDAMESLASRLAHPGRAALAFAVPCLIGAALICIVHRDQVRCTDFTEADDEDQARTVLAALRDEPGSPRTKLLVFPQPAWRSATGIAILLKRMGYRPRVLPDWRVMFGDDLVLDDSPSAEPVDIWRIVPAEANPSLATQRPLIDGFALQVEGSQAIPRMAPPPSPGT